jgi:predicted nucleic acid-binding protein
VIFFDSSAAYALADRADPNHESARSVYSSLREGLLTHSYVLVEGIALLQRRMGVSAALRFAAEADQVEVVWVDGPLHAEALSRFAARRRRHASLVDEVSFLVMRRRGLDTAFAFDEDFRREGFRLLG